MLQYPFFCFVNFLDLPVAIKVQTEAFLEVDTDDNKFKNVKVVLVTADCSKSGIANPIDFVVNEGEGGHFVCYC